MTLKQFSGWQFMTVVLERGHSLVCYNYMDKGKPVSLHDVNHNIFRLDANGEVVWQVVRDERGKLDFEAMHAHAVARGEDGEHELFMNLLVVRPDGTRPEKPNSRDPLDIDIWTPGCRVYSNAFSGHRYLLDIESGIAVNVTPHRQRPW